jgi:hypothetical protein
MKAETFFRSPVKYASDRRLESTAIATPAVQQI